LDVGRVWKKLIILLIEKDKFEIIMTKTYRQTLLEEFEGFSEIAKAEAENQERVRELYGRFHANKGRDSTD
jgi:hypothetical protein